MILKVPVPHKPDILIETGSLDLNEHIYFKNKHLIPAGNGHFILNKKLQ
jgi:hypothetical protein